MAQLVIGGDKTQIELSLCENHVGPRQKFPAPVGLIILFRTPVVGLDRSSLLFFGIIGFVITLLTAQV